MSKTIDLFKSCFKIWAIIISAKLLYATFVAKDSTGFYYGFDYWHGFCFNNFLNAYSPEKDFFIWIVLFPVIGKYVDKNIIYPVAMVCTVLVLLFGNISG